MEPWTDGAPLNFNQNSHRPRTPRAEPWTDGAPLILKWFDGLSGFVNDLELQEEGSDGRPCGFSRLIGSYGFGGFRGLYGFTGFSGFYGSGGLILRVLRV